MKILTFDIGGDFIKYGVVNEKFKLLETHKVPTEAQKGGQRLIERIIDIIESYKGIDRVAVSTAGQVDSENGIVVYSTGKIPYYTGMMVKRLIENKTGIPTFVENNVNAEAMGEAMFGAAKGQTDFISLTYGNGIGGALYMNGKLYKGSGSSAGELGHMITHAGGKQCNCGGEGCYECYASAKALVNSVNRVVKDPLDAFQIFEKENFERPEIRFEIDKWVDEIIVGLINIIYTFNPPLIVLGGGIMNEDYIIDLIDRKIYNRLMDNYRNVNIVRSKLGNDAALLGVAYLASNIK
ncbi:MAG: ROK family protein [Eubacterium sp.]|nr:ROK family protein [Eubacterium sp.]MBQ8981714.1 ROK family protein [Eubacterium sp.]MBR1531311.1 ROK family protein [Eubacterium sp.]MBR2278444.1 ROK family protein [Eubacterium sp.]